MLKPPGDGERPHTRTHRPLLEAAGSGLRLPGFKSQVWVQIPGLLLVGCVSLDKSFNFSEHHSTHLEIKIISA